MADHPDFTGSLPNLGVVNIDAVAGLVLLLAKTHVQWGDVATWATAVVGAVAAVYVAFQLSATRDALNAQRKQLQAQQVQAAEDSAYNRLSSDVLREQLAQLKDERERAARQQAENVSVIPDTFTEGPDGLVLLADEYAYGVRIVNRTGRPIHKVYGGIIRPGEEVYGYAGARMLIEVPTGPRTRSPVEQEVWVENLANGYGYALIFGVKTDNRSAFQHPNIAVRFVDDAGRAWQVDPGGAVTRFNPDQWTEPLGSTVVDRPITTLRPGAARRGRNIVR